MRILLSGAVLFLCGCGGSTLLPDAAGGGADTGITPDSGLDGASPDDASALDASPTECPPPPSCDAPLPSLGPTADWRHTSSRITAALGSPNHRGRDLYLTEAGDQWALGKFAYGFADDDIKDEDVDIYLLRGCAGDWESLGSATTTRDGDHAPVEGVEDTGGRVYFEIPGTMRLGLGRHRILFVVRGDQSVADQYIEVLLPETRFVVTDVDGTQTETENAEYGAILGGRTVNPQPSGADLLQAFSRRGYHVFYLTARPEWLHTRTHEWLSDNGYPDGNVHTTLRLLGGLGNTAVDFKTRELGDLLSRFPGSIEVSIGNTATDAEAFDNVGISPENAWLYQFDPGPLGTRVDDYADRIPYAESLPLACP